jgi:bifunctional DNA-binding transcriptional regulator/antitoxin component of YhaV-PrlF toxin-antitoxin module
MRTTVTSRGQTVVPAKIRRDHAIQPETLLEWIDDGLTIRVVPLPADSIGAAIGSTKGLGEKLLIERWLDRDRE